MEKIRQYWIVQKIQYKNHNIKNKIWCSFEDDN